MATKPRRTAAPVSTGRQISAAEMAVMRKIVHSVWANSLKPAAQATHRQANEYASRNSENAKNQALAKAQSAALHQPNAQTRWSVSHAS